jgi:uncharacterized protein YukE
VTTLPAANSKLATQLEASQPYIKKLKDEMADLKAKIKSAWQGQIPAKMTSNNTHCWSHGYQVHKDHTSATCNA